MKAFRSIQFNSQIQFYYIQFNCQIQFCYIQFNSQIQFNSIQSIQFYSTLFYTNYTSDIGIFFSDLKMERNICRSCYFFFLPRSSSLLTRFLTLGAGRAAHRARCVARRCKQNMRHAVRDCANFVKFVCKCANNPEGRSAGATKESEAGDLRLRQR